MRTLILFGVLALCFIVALGDFEEETEAVADVLVREAREAGKKGQKGQKGQKKKSGKRGSKRKNGRGRKSSNRRRYRKQNKKNQKKKKNSSKKRMNIRLERQGSVDCNMTAVKVVANIYTKSISLGRNAKQAKKIYKQVNNKFSKCATAFVDPAKALGEGTKLGTTCDKAVANSTIQKDYITLNNCSVSSCALCDMSGLGVDEARLDTCETQLKNVSDTAIACLRSLSCTCLDTPPTIPEDCDPYVKTVLDAVKEVKKQCTGGDVLGSFTNCSGLAKEVPKNILTCGKVEPNGPTDTMTATGRARDLRGMFNAMML